MNKVKFRINTVSTVPFALKIIKNGYFDDSIRPFQTFRLEQRLQRLQSRSQDANMEAYIKQLESQVENLKQAKLRLKDELINTR